MSEITTKSSNEEEIKLVQEGEGVTDAATTAASATEAPKRTPEPDSSRAGGGWGGWGFSAFSVLSDLQKAATVAAEEISRNVPFSFLHLVCAFGFPKFSGLFSHSLILIVRVYFRLYSRTEL